MFPATQRAQTSAENRTGPGGGEDVCGGEGVRGKPGAREGHDRAMQHVVRTLLSRWPESFGDTARVVSQSDIAQRGCVFSPDVAGMVELFRHGGGWLS